jgi:acyl-coenzyme A thioesterase PaaI-like protein
MDVTDIPFNKFLGIRKTQQEESHRLELPASPLYMNHVGSVHAAAQLALAEAASGEFLLEASPEYEGRVLAVVRRTEAKFRNPMTGRVFSRVAISAGDVRKSAEPLATKSRAIIPVTIEIIDDSGAVGLIATFEWFVQKITPEASQERG